MNSSSPARLRPFRPVPFGRYTLLSQLATGGMGEIFLARLEGAQGFEKLCVIKKILPQLAADPEFVERFVGEARTLVKLSHGSIAQVLDMGLHEGEAYMALEYVDGKDLRKVAARARDRQKPLPLPFVLFVVGRVLDALAYAHRKKGDDDAELNLVHRDISPQNVLISYEGEVKVIDFGLAKSRLSAAKTNPSIILGKFLYMSPEQARHQPVDRRSDLYAVGLCLYELLAGRNPFDLLAPGELMTAVAQPDIRPLQEVAPATPPAVAQLVMRALAVDPAQRFQSAEELRGRLASCLLEVDASAGPESVSGYMHELFAPEYQAERRLLASLKEVPGGQEGSVEALSFHPTQRSREAGPVREDNETRPAVVMEQTTRPDVSVEVLKERPSGSSTPTREVPVSEVMLQATLAPAPVPQEPPVVAAIEDTPNWAEPLAAEEPEAPSIPIDILADTNPRIELPEASREDVYHQDTQPRVVLDASLLRDEAPPPSRPTRLRTTTPGAVASSPRLASAPKVAEVAVDEQPLRTPSPKRPGRLGLWVSVVLAVVMVGLGAGAVAFALKEEPERVEPPPAIPIRPPEEKTAQPAPAEEAPAPAEAAPAVPEVEAEARALLAPLATEPKPEAQPAPTRRLTSRKRTSVRQSALQKEWGRTRSAFLSLNKVYACESLDHLCSRYEVLAAEVEAQEEGQEAELLGKVKSLRREILNRRKRGR